MLNPLMLFAVFHIYYLLLLHQNFKLITFLYYLQKPFLIKQLLITSLDCL